MAIQKPPYSVIGSSVLAEWLRKLYDYVVFQISDHNNLNDIQGGVPDERFHLTQAQHLDLTNGGNSTTHFHDSDRARANHTGTQLAATISDFEAAISALMINGEMYSFNSSTAIVITTANTWTAITSGFTQGDCDGVTFQNNSELKIVTPGKYVVVWSLSMDASAAAVEIEAGILVNGTLNEKTAAHRFFGTANDTGHLSSHGLLTLATDDVITLAVNNNTNTTDVTMEHANVLLTRWLG